MQIVVQVLGLVFSIHRERDRFWNEPIYQNELALPVYSTRVVKGDAMEQF
ncbi:MAG: hypothetical protein ACE5HS_06455 [bacterium]